jgi:RsiW-degrading membrane proteinase PrsW (M82 family)
MLSDNNLLLFILAFLPALVYSYIIYFNDRNNIKFRTTLSYIIGGCIAITFFDVFTTVFPKFQEMLFTVPNGAIDLTTMTLRQKPTLLTWVMFAFVQVAMLEETVKAMAWKMMSLFRKGDYNKNDTLFATMFYSCMISVGFAGIENLQYLINYHDIFIERSLTAVITHMVCGIFMGYFIATSRIKRGLFERIGYQLMGVASAALFHGLYDYSVMTMGDYHLPFKFPFTETFLQPFHFVILIGLTLATICGRNLLNYSLRYGKIQRTKRPLPPAK